VLDRIVLDIGCGERKVPGSVGLDIAALPGVDIVSDIEHGLPLRDSSIDAFHASHVLEHVDNLIGLMNEVWRAGKPGARFYITVPHATSSFMTWRDPTHKRGLNLSTFTYFDETTEEGRVFSYYSKARFRRVYGRLRFAAGGRKGREAPGRRLISRLATDLLEAVANSSPRAQHLCERWWGGWLGVAEAYAVLEVVK
jgi:SAM-dependent methyltransferase